MLKLGMIKYIVKSRMERYLSIYSKEWYSYWLDEKMCIGNFFFLDLVDIDKPYKDTEFYYVEGKRRRIYTIKEEPQFYV